MATAESRHRGPELSEGTLAAGQPPSNDTGSTAEEGTSGVASEEFEGNVDFPGGDPAGDEEDGTSKPSKKKKSRKKLTAVTTASDVKNAKELAKVSRRNAKTAADYHDGRMTTGLRKGYGITLLAVLGLQLLIVDFIFYRFLVGNNFDVSDAVMITFLTSVVVEVIGLVSIVATSLFRNPGSRSAKGSNT